MSYLTKAERYRIETMLKDGVKVKEIAQRLGRHYTTIYKEIKKGMVEQLNSDLTVRCEYCADYADMVTCERGHNKGLVKDFVYNKELLGRLGQLVGRYHYSPYAAVQIVKSEGFVSCGEVTLYKYIHNGLIPGVSDKDLYIKKNKKPKKLTNRIDAPALKKLKGKSIEERPQEVKKVNSYGHWEMDTVYSGTHTRSKTALLVLTERMTLDQLTFRMPDRSLKSVVAQLDNLENMIGYDAFKAKFKTITADNGSEFGDSTLIERSVSDSQKLRTQVYFCHPYCSSERGRNENQNRFYRRWVERGGDLGKLSVEQWDEINDWINHYPRKKYHGMSSADFKKSLGIA